MRVPDELHPASLQIAITVALALLSWSFYRRYRKPYYAWWGVAWLCYTARLGAITQFLRTEDYGWLYWHQVLTGWTALALLAAALAFSMRPTWPRWLLLAPLFPLGWSYVAIYEFDHFLAAAIPAVAFLGFATLATAGIFIRHWRQVRGSGALILSAAFLLWGVHHFDYPFLRARGAWVPWGYYLDILFTLAVGAGMLLLVIDDLQQGVHTFSALAVNTAPTADTDVVRETIERPLTLPAVRGAALFTLSEGAPRCVAAAGVCAAWTDHRLSDAEGAVIARAISAGRVQSGQRVFRDAANGQRYAFAAVLPLFAMGNRDGASSALAVVGDARDPFAALDESFLLAIGHQIGRAIEREELRRRLLARTAELQRLSTRMVAQHEDERRRLSLELHDETAQLFAAVTMHLGLIRERADPSLATDLAAALDLVAEGMRSVRRVTQDLRPALLDDLGLESALRALVSAIAERSDMKIGTTFAILPSLAPEAEAALYRALQELLTNVVRHADAREIRIRIEPRGDAVALTVDDDGRGFPEVEVARLERQGHSGLAGMRERIAALGGRVGLGTSPIGGARATVELPIRTVAAV